MNDLIASVIKAGGPILGTVIGGPVGTLAGAAIGALADALGTPATPEAVKEAIDTRPDAAAIVQKVEAEKAPEFYALLAKEADTYRALVDRESSQGWFYSAWRPAGMWVVLTLWVWAMIAAPIFGKLVDFAALNTFTGLYVMFYMGGHNLKQWIDSKSGKP